MRLRIFYSTRVLVAVIALTLLYFVERGGALSHFLIMVFGVAIGAEWTFRDMIGRINSIARRIDKLATRWRATSKGLTAFVDANMTSSEVPYNEIESASTTAGVLERCADQLDGGAGRIEK